jgi:hypothetical protein
LGSDGRARLGRSGDQSGEQQQGQHNMMTHAGDYTVGRASRPAAGLQAGLLAQFDWRKSIAVDRTELNGSEQADILPPRGGARPAPIHLRTSVPPPKSPPTERPHPAIPCAIRERHSTGCIQSATRPPSGRRNHAVFAIDGARTLPRGPKTTHWYSPLQISSGRS